jgi:hypothetical protein
MLLQCGLRPDHFCHANPCGCGPKHWHLLATMRLLAAIASWSCRLRDGFRLST